MSQSELSVALLTRVDASGGEKTEMPHSITVCLTAGGASSSTWLKWPRCVWVWEWVTTFCSGDPVWGVIPEKFWNFRCRFLLSGTLSAKKINSCKSAEYDNSSSRLYHVQSARADTKKRDNWHPARITTARGTGARKQEVLAKTWWVATLLLTVVLVEQSCAT